MTILHSKLVTRENIKNWIELDKNLKMHDEMTRITVINRDYDIPYLAGYSKDGKTTYIDRHMPISVKVKNKVIIVTVPLVTHERTEKGILLNRATVATLLNVKEKDIDYQFAHGIATVAEEDWLSDYKIRCEDYEIALKPYIKMAEFEKIQKVPEDLDLEPYRDWGDERLVKLLVARGVKA